VGVDAAEAVLAAARRRAAVLTGVVLDSVERDGVPASYRMPVTQTWVEVEGGWLCLAGHAGPLLAS
jgi:hypothetical protein